MKNSEIIQGLHSEQAQPTITTTNLVSTSTKVIVDNTKAVRADR